MASFGQQLRALIWRNILLKKRNRGQLLQELLFPVYFVALLAIIKAITKPETKPAEQFPPHNLSYFLFRLPPNRFIYASPNTPEVVPLMSSISRQLGVKDYLLFPTPELAEAAYLANDSIVSAGIIFNFSANFNSYAIRIPYQQAPTPGAFNSDKGACSGSKDGLAFCSVNQYLWYGFAQLQLAVENALLEVLNVSTGRNSDNVRVQMMDKAEFTPDTSYIQTLSSIYFVFSFSFLANFLAVKIVAEKEKKIKDGMMMMGLRNSVFWLSWAIVYFVLVVVASAIMTIIVLISKFFTASNLFLLFLSFVLYGSSIICFAFMITPFFNKAKVAGAITGFSTVIISCIYLGISQTRDSESYDSKVPAVVQWLLCLLSPISFATFIDQGIYLDIHMGGFGFSDIMTYGKFPLYAPLLMLVVDIVLYSLLTIYLDNVIPGEFGVKKSPLYFLQASYWCPGQQSNAERLHLINQALTPPDTVDVEPVGSEMEQKVAVRISSLSKSFDVDGKTQKAVDRFSLDIYESHITCLLGHNGAGKTTLINMLTGVIPPTSGSAVILGLDITQSGNMDKIRRKCGICPQHNILYDELSCREHLEMFANIKGVWPQSIDSTVEQALADVDLRSQAETFAKDLSGGQKRKLSVAIALIGDPQLIFLDEPTAGMDPFSRRHLWSMLKRLKVGKVVLLTTHFMDEADILADRKAFIRKGQLRCCGSSLFLKNKFGIGYHLTMVVTPNCNVADVTQLLQSVIPKIEHTRTHGKEIAYTVPLQEVSRFSELFGQLDSAAEEYGIKSYGVSMTTLEEVFLKLEADELLEHGEETLAEVNPAYSVDNGSVNGDMRTPLSQLDTVGKSTVQGSDLIKQRFWALLKIRFILQLQDKKALFFQVMIPILLVIVGLVLAKVNEATSVETSTPFNLAPSTYIKPAGVAGSSLPPLLVFDANNTNQSQAVISSWMGQYSVDSYKAGAVNLSQVAPHSLGVQIDRVGPGQDLSNFLVLYNDSAVHSIPATINLATQAILAGTGLNLTINASSFPWPPLSKSLVYNAGAMFSTMLIGLSFILILPGFAAEVVRDREWKLRSQLRISGVTFNLYWGSIYVCDFLIYLLPCITIIIISLAMQLKGLSSGGAILSMVLLFLTNIPFNIVLALVLSFIFNKADSCTAYLPILLDLFGMVPYLIVSLVDMIAHNSVAIVIHYVACILDPAYIMFGGFYFINRVSLTSLITGDSINTSTYLEFDNHIVICIIMPVIHIFWIYWLLRVLDVWKAGGRVVEAFPCLSKPSMQTELVNTDLPDLEDVDVKAERMRVESFGAGTGSEPVAYMSQLRKVFVKRTKSEGLCKPGKSSFKIAVRNLSIGVDRGEVLGLLGPNGAGKSTALNMVIAEAAPTCGKVVVSGHNIRSNFLSVVESLGYCPQHDALWEKISLEEHIRCFAAIKGVDPREMDRVVDYFVGELKLEEHRKKPAVKLSGGTKRKLSYILSILGSPEFVLLDEPSTGMDPKSKRFLWDTISSSFSGTQRGAILTTHYMEEADALCGRVGIMVNGQLECLGATQHLKSKYGSGYILEVKLKLRSSTDVDSQMDSLEAYLLELFPGLEKVERFQERGQYSIPKKDVISLGQTFSSLENCKQTHGLEEYSFSQSSLEQVFLYFAKQQLEEGEDENVRKGHKHSVTRISSTVHAMDVV